jgi:hypothetical protein
MVCLPRAQADDFADEPPSQIHADAALGESASSQWQTCGQTGLAERRVCDRSVPIRVPIRGSDAARAIESGAGHQRRPGAAATRVPRPAPLSKRRAGSANPVITPPPAASWPVSSPPRRAGAGRRGHRLAPAFHALGGRSGLRSDGSCARLMTTMKLLERLLAWPKERLGARVDNAKGCARAGRMGSAAAFGSPNGPLRTFSRSYTRAAT